MLNVENKDPFSKDTLIIYLKLLLEECLKTFEIARIHPKLSNEIKTILGKELK